MRTFEGYSFDADIIELFLLAATLLSLYSSLPCTRAYHISSSLRTNQRTNTYAQVLHGRGA